MTTYEAIMVMLGTLTLMMSIISIVIKLLLYIIENNAKKITTSKSFGKHWGSYFSQKNSKASRLWLFLFHLYYNLW